jgi:hypothetical protein
MAEPLAGAPESFNKYLSEWCRAGDELSFNMVNQTTTPIITNIQFNTISGYSPCFADVQCWSTECLSYTFALENNIWFGSAYAPENENILPAMCLNEPPTVTDHNDYYNLRECPPAQGATDLCPGVDPLLIAPPPLELNQESDFDTTSYGISANSPAVGAGSPIAGITTDFNGNPRPNPPSLGALEPGSTFAIQDYLAPDPARNPPTGLNQPTIGNAAYHLF